jgi:hypothetical protein
MEDRHYKYNTHCKYVLWTLKQTAYSIKCANISQGIDTQIKEFISIKALKPDYLDLWCQW